MQAASRDKAWRLRDDAYQEEQKQTAKVQKMAKREKRRLCAYAQLLFGSNSYSAISLDLKRPDLT